MYNKKITFGAGDALIFNDFNIKKKIIDYLYDSVDLSNYRFSMLENLERLKYLKDNPHFVSPNFRGINYLVIFLNIDGKNYCMALERKKLSYHKKQINIKHIKMIRSRVYVSNDIFKGTILDCKMMFSRDRKNHFMIIKDSYHLMGNDLTDMDMMKKLSLLNSIINTKFYKNHSENFVFKINKLYNYDKLEEIVEKVIPDCIFPIVGLEFFPKKSGNTIVYIKKEQKQLNFESTEIITQNSCDFITDFTNALKNRTYEYESNGIKKKLWLKRTAITEVYNVYNKKSDDKKLGIAHIPNLKISQLCNEKINSDKILFNCVYHKKFEKWIPVSLC